MTRRQAYLAIPLIAGLVSFIYVGCIGLNLLLNLPWDLSLPLALRLSGVPLIALGLALIAWVVRFRGPGALLESTYATLLKLIRRLPLAIPGGRTEPLVVAGPYRLVRHPLYSGILGMALGIGLLVDHPWALLGAAVLGAWFALVLAPFEERELEALFGEAYVEYERTHRRFLPIPRRNGSR